MTEPRHGSDDVRPVLLCFDGSDDATAAIAKAGELVGARAAVVLNVWQSIATWEPYDPASILGAPLSKLASNALDLDEVAEELAHEKVERGLALAREAGFDPSGQVAKGKAWRRICDVGEELDARLIVLGARGLSRVQSALLGSVSSAVVVHAGRPVLVIPPSARAETAAQDPDIRA
jgi:nucleotide-binding universal stress UspA family protein